MTVLTYPYLVVSDVHFHAWDFGSYVNPDGVNSRLQDTITEFERAASVLREQGGECIVITGDLFHTRGEIKPSVYNPVYDMFKRLSENGFDIHAIPGNHDLETEETTEEGNCFKSFASIKNFHIYYKPTYVYFEKNYSRDKALFIPWTENFGGQLYKAVEASKESTRYSRTDPVRTTIFAHVGISGVVTGIKSALNAESFNQVQGLRYAFCGHFHNHKHFDVSPTGQQSHVYSVGALTHQSFKDVGSRAGFIIVSSPEKVTFHNSEAPEFVDYDDHDWLAAETPCKFRNNFVRMNVGTALLKEEIEAIRVTLESCGSLRVINRIAINEDSGIKVPSEAASPAIYVFGSEAAASMGAEFVKYLETRYDKIMADRMTAIFEKDGIDES
jgi:DNA repair exonuclease SbcCD nuclease subunit